MKYKIIGLVGLCVASFASADMGLGVSVQDDDSRLYLPINVNKSFRVEPLVRFFESEKDGSSSYEQEFIALVFSG